MIKAKIRVNSRIPKFTDLKIHHIVNKMNNIIKTRIETDYFNIFIKKSRSQTKIL